MAGFRLLIPAIRPTELRGQWTPGRVLGKVLDFGALLRFMVDTVAPVPA
jgi:hypothetical protein